MLKVGVIDAGGGFCAAMKSAADNVGVKIRNPVINAGDMQDFKSWIERELPDPVEYLVIVLDGSVPDPILYSDSWLDQLNEYCKSTNTAKILISSSAVFSRSEGKAFVESDTPSPETEFGHYCLSVEERLQHGGQCLVLRTGWLFGVQSSGMLQKIIESMNAEGLLDFPPDQIGHPTFYGDIARVVVGVIEQLACMPGTDLWSLYHYGSAEAVSKQSFSQLVANEMAQYGDFPPAQSVSTLYINRLKAPVYGLDGSMDCTKILFNFGIKQRSWRHDVSAILAKRYASDDTV